MGVATRVPSQSRRGQATSWLGRGSHHLVPAPCARPHPPPASLQGREAEIVRSLEDKTPRGLAPHYKLDTLSLKRIWLARPGLETALVHWAGAHPAGLQGCSNEHPGLPSPVSQGHNQAPSTLSLARQTHQGQGKRQKGAKLQDQCHLWRVSGPPILTLLRREQATKQRQ